MNEKQISEAVNLYQKRIEGWGRVQNGQLGSVIDLSSGPSAEQLSFLAGRIERLAALRALTPRAERKHIEQYLVRCTKFFSSYSVLPRRVDSAAISPAMLDQFSHSLWMLGEAGRFLAERRVEKALRWLGFVAGCLAANNIRIDEPALHRRHAKLFFDLGFVQGYLWKFGLYTIDELKEHNRPAAGVRCRKRGVGA